MTEDLSQPVRLFWEDVWTRGEVSMLEKIIAPDARENGEPMVASELAEGVKTWRGMVEDFSITIDELLVIDDRVVTRVTYRGKQVGPWGPLQPKGATFEVMGIDIFRVRDGQITQLWHSVDHLIMVKALGGRIVAQEEAPAT